VFDYILVIEPLQMDRWCQSHSRITEG